MRKRTELVTLRVTPEEKLAWTALAEADDLTLADLVRSRLGHSDAVGREPKKKRIGRKADPVLLANVGRVGSNLNQIARWANSFKSAAEASEVLLALVAIEQLLQAHVPGARDAQ